jgi:hypothetical protein
MQTSIPPLFLSRFSCHRLVTHRQLTHDTPWRQALFIFGLLPRLLSFLLSLNYHHHHNKIKQNRCWAAFSRRRLHGVHPVRISRFFFLSFSFSVSVQNRAEQLQHEHELAAVFAAGCI